MTNEEAYTFVVEAARRFKFSAAELYVRRLLTHIGVSKADLRASHFPRMCTAALEMRADELSKDGLDTFVSTLRKVAVDAKASGGVPPQKP